MNEQKKCIVGKYSIILSVLFIASAGGNVLQHLYWTGRCGADSARFTAEQRRLESTITDLERQRSIDGERIERLETIQRSSANAISNATGILTADGERLSNLTDIIRRIREAVKVLEASGVYRDTNGGGDSNGDNSHTN